MHFPSGRHLRAARVLAGLSRKQLAAIAGCHHNSIAYWEAKTGIITGYVPQRLAEVLASRGVSADNTGNLRLAA